MTLPTTLCSVLLFAGTSAIPADDTYSLRWVPKEGDTSTYTMNCTFAVQVGNATLTQKTVEKVIKVATDGSYSVQYTPGEGSAEYQGQKFPVGKTISITTYKADGEILSVTGLDTNPTSVRYQNLSGFRRPDNPVKMGESWTFDIKADAKAEIVADHFVGKLVDAETYQNIPVLKVTISSHEVDVANPGSIDGIYLIDQKDGSLVDYKATWTSVMFPGNPTPLNGSMEMVRVAN